MIYDPLSIPDGEKFMALWNDLSLKNGLAGIHFVGLASGWLEIYQQILNKGFNAIAPSNLWIAESKVKGKLRKILEHKLRQSFPAIWLNKYKYKDIIKNFYTEYDYKENCYPSIIPQWDRSPRSGRRAVIYSGSTPKLFKKHVEHAIQIVAKKSPENRIVFLRSWNEWAEGNYVEPDLKFGKGYLEALKSTLI